MTLDELQERINIMANSVDWRKVALEIADDAERLMKENESLRGYNAQCDLIAVENARLSKEKIDSLLDWAALWKSKAKKLYRVMGAFDEEHASIVTSNMRLANENGIMREALAEMANHANYYTYDNYMYFAIKPDGSNADINGHTPWEYAQSKLDELKRSE